MGDAGWSPGTLASLPDLGSLGTARASAVWFWLLGRASLTTLETTLFLVPAGGVVSGVIGGDHLQLVELVGITAPLAGIALASLPGRSGRVRNGPGSAVAARAGRPARPARSSFAGGRHQSEAR